MEVTSLFCKVIFGFKIKWVGNTANNESRPCRRKKGFFHYLPKFFLSGTRPMSLVLREKELMKYYCKTCTIIIGIMEQIGTVVDSIPEVLSSSMEMKEKYKSKWLEAFRISILEFQMLFYGFFLFRIFSSKWVKT